MTPSESDRPSTVIGQIQNMSKLGQGWLMLVILGLFVTGGLILVILLPGFGPRVTGSLSNVLLAIVLIQFLTLAALRPVLPRVFPDVQEDSGSERAPGDETRDRGQQS